MMKRMFKCFALLLVAMFLTVGIKAEAAPDYGNQTITATGMGVAKAGTSGGHARILARRAAIADAQRNLLEAVKEVYVEGGTEVVDAMLSSDVVRTKVSGTLKGARIVSENITSDGAYEVTMQIGMFGVGGLAEAVIPRPETPPIAFPTPQTTVPSPTAPSTTITITATGGYTGVVIDCRGLGLNPVMSPVIKDNSGVKLYGHQNLDYDMVIRDGMASYAHDMSQASRAGSNPLVIKAERLDDHNANPVLSVTDGNRMLLENNSAGFLSKTAVVFLY